MYQLLFKHDLVMVDDTDYTWKVQYEGFVSASQRHCRLTAGWTTFIKLKNVRVGASSLTFIKLKNVRAAESLTQSSPFFSLFSLGLECFPTLFWGGGLGGVGYALQPQKRRKDTHHPYRVHNSPRHGKREDNCSLNPAQNMVGLMQNMVGLTQNMVGLTQIWSFDSKYASVWCVQAHRHRRMNALTYF